jgi:hypothetical protein
MAIHLSWILFFISRSVTRMKLPGCDVSDHAACCFCVLVLPCAGLMDIDLDNDGDDGDQLLAIGAAIRDALGTGTDPYTVAGMLAEGAAFAIEHVPSRKRKEAGTALMLMLRERLNAHGIG